MPAVADKPRLPAGPPAAGWLVLPNLITLGRLIAVPVILLLILRQRLDLAFMVFVFAGVSDALDGWLARSWQAHTRLGAILDPLADKALMATVYGALAFIGILPMWLAILVVARDGSIMAGVVTMRLLRRPLTIRPLAISKLNTLLQILLAGLALGLAGFGLAAPTLMAGLLLLVACVTIASGVAYAAQAVRRAA